MCWKYFSLSEIGALLSHNALCSIILMTGIFYAPAQKSSYFSCLIIAEKLVWRRTSRGKECPPSSLLLDSSILVPGRGWLMLVICVSWSVLACGSHFIADRKKPVRVDLNGLDRWCFWVLCMDWYTCIFFVFCRISDLHHSCYKIISFRSLSHLKGWRASIRSLSHRHPDLHIFRKL